MTFRSTPTLHSIGSSPRLLAAAVAGCGCCWLARLSYRTLPKSSRNSLSRAGLTLNASTHPTDPIVVQDRMS